MESNKFQYLRFNNRNLQIWICQWKISRMQRNLYFWQLFRDDSVTKYNSICTYYATTTVDFGRFVCCFLKSVLEFAQHLKFFARFLIDSLKSILRIVYRVQLGLIETSKIFDSKNSLRYHRHITCGSLFYRCY